jgi:hypothetical protein
MYSLSNSLSKRKRCTIGTEYIQRESPAVLGREQKGSARREPSEGRRAVWNAFFIEAGSGIVPTRVDTGSKTESTEGSARTGQDRLDAGTPRKA